MINTSDDPASTPARHLRLALGVFLALLLTALGISYWMYNRQVAVQEEQVKESLARIYTMFLSILTDRLFMNASAMRRWSALATSLATLLVL